MTTWLKDWAVHFFNSPVLSIQSLPQGTQHHLFLIRLVNGHQWLCKIFSSQTWLGKTTKENLLTSELIAEQVSQQLSLTPAVYQRDAKNAIISIGGAPAVVRPFIRGKTCSSVNLFKTFILGQALAKLHGLSFTHISALPFPAITWPKNNNCPSWLREIVEQCNSVISNRPSWVISHRDLHLGNVIWQSNSSIQLIDWESAGLIHPAIELLGLACNCAGIPQLQFNVSLFKNTLKGYRAISGKLPEIDSVLFNLIWHSWLLWYVHAYQKNWTIEIKNSWNVIEFIKTIKQEIEKVYYEND